MTDVAPLTPQPLAPQAEFDAALLGRLPPHARRLVEFGCGDGLLGGLYLRQNPAAEYLGVEDRPDLASRAGQRLGRVLAAIFDQATIDGPVDCLVYNDVWDRFRDPEAALARHLKLLTDEGMVVLSIPNPQSAGALAAQLAGRGHGGKVGARTLEQVREMFSALDLHVLDVAEVAAAQPPSPILRHHLRMSGEALGLSVEALDRRLGIDRFIIRAGRTRPRPLLLHHVTLLPGPGQSQVSEVRIHRPAAFVGALPAVEILVQPFREMTLQDRGPGIGKICILQRLILQKDWGVNLLRHLLRENYLVIGEWDDHPDHWPAIAANEHLALRGPHALQTSTPALRAELMRHNGEVGLFPNQVWDYPPQIRKLAGEVTLFFGALNREKDWQPCVEALNAVLAARPRLHVEIVHDRKLFDALATANKRFTPTCPHGEYQRLLGASDIAFLPLADTPFNRMKSDLKFIEAAAQGAVALASPTVYGETLVDGETGLIFADADELRNKLLTLVDDSALRQRLARNAREYVRRERLLAAHAGARLDWYRSLLARREELNIVLRQRLPALFD